MKYSYSHSEKKWITVIKVLGKNTLNMSGEHALGCYHTNGIKINERVVQVGDANTKYINGLRNAAFTKTKSRAHNKIWNDCNQHFLRRLERTIMV